MVHNSDSPSTSRKKKIAVIGSGPAAFYASNELLKQSDPRIEIDMFERLPTPYGLVRGGVAPDHQNIKAVIKIYERTAQKKGFRFFGNVTFGTDVTKKELLNIYDCIIYATGCESDRHLNIPGEQLKNIHSATEFVGWYNGHPDYTELEFDFSGKSVAIIGMGNVAIDVARILVRSTDELAQTDIADAALEKLKHSQIKDIYLIGRRGPVQAAFTSIEARELLTLSEAQPQVKAEDLELDEASRSLLESPNHQGQVLNIKYLNMMVEPQTSKPKTIHFLFKSSPIELFGDQGKIQSIHLAKNDLVVTEDGRIKAIPSSETFHLETELVFRSIGYIGTPLPDVSFDEEKGIIPNIAGKVIDGQGEILPREYVTGWAKRGPTGVIGSNKKDALETIHKLLEDLPHFTSNAPHDESEPDPTLQLMQSKRIDFVSFSDWKLLDHYEIESGKRENRVRKKICHVSEMLEIIRKESRN